MPDLEPITRDEMLWSGEDVEPITRREMYIRHLYDETQAIPEKPITREEMFILKAGEELHDVTIEQLNVSENGTYSESGKAYSPVIVNVPAPPLPDNAYLLNEVEGLPKDIATFTDGSNLPMPSLKTTIVPIQSGSGDPSPTNIRPISGWSEANMSVCGVNVWDEQWETGGYSFVSGTKDTSTNQIRNKNLIPIKPNTTYFIQTTDNVDYGILIYCYAKDRNYLGCLFRDGTLHFDGQQFYKNQIATIPSGVYYINIASSATYGNTYNNDLSINYPSTDTSYHAYNGHTYTIPFTDSQGNPIEVYGGELDVVNGGGSAYKEYDSYNGETLIGPWISDRDVYVPNTSPTTGAQVVDMGDTSTFISQPTSIKSLEGTNNVWGDCGQIKEGSYFAKSEEE